MRQQDEVLLVLSTVPDRETGRKIADHLVEYRLAACVNLLPAIDSTYRWQNAVQRDSENLLMIKTTRTAYPAMEAAVRRLHPYELPEIIAVPVAAGLPDYLAWVAASLEKDR